MPTDDRSVKAEETDETEISVDNAEETLPVPPPSFRERLQAAQRARRLPDVFVAAKPDKPRQRDNTKKNSHER